MIKSETSPTDSPYSPAYFTAQINKSAAKVAWQYGRIMSLAGVKTVAGRHVLDVGCGAGPGLRYLVAQGAKAVGLDHSFYALETAQKLVAKAEFILTNGAVSFPCINQSFDLVLLSEIIEHLSEAKTILTESRRILKPGGQIIITTPNLWDIRRFVASKKWSGFADPTHINLYTPLRLVTEMREAGFSKLRWRTGIKPLKWISAPKLHFRLALPYPPCIGNGLLVTGFAP